MSKKNSLVTINLPDEVGNLTINELLEMGGDVQATANKVSVRKTMETGVVSFQFETFPEGGAKEKFANLLHKKKKEEYREDIIAMKQSGMKQKDIADELGISPSYVTQLLKDCSQSQFLFSNGVSPSYVAKMPKMKDE